MVAIFFLVLLLSTPFVFSLLIGSIVGYAAWEWSNLSGISGTGLRLGYSAVVLVVVLITAYFLGVSPSTSDSTLDVDVGKSFLLWLTPWWAIALLWVQGYPSSSVLWGSCWARAIMGLLVLVPAWLAATILIYTEQGEWLFFSVVLIVALADIGAYFSGRKFGKNKLAPNVSPKKTWEGVLGGIVANMLLVLLIVIFFQLGVVQWIVVLLLVGATVLASVLGDLLESMVKRHRGVKDSGNILPGHGGVLDRIDGFTAALPVFTLIFLCSDFPL